MANKRDLKKDINYVLGDIIEAVYLWEYENTPQDTSKSEAIIDEAIATFDALITQVNDRRVTNKKAHFRAIHRTLEQKAIELIEQVNALG